MGNVEKLKWKEPSVLDEDMVFAIALNTCYQLYIRQYIYNKTS